ncbi:MAG: hypothetical protein M1827_004108 [Pycnora praestabilis]|nr:MAG: hypothetical protein M1827_004108 [Pycnora praestabilis]
MRWQILKYCYLQLPITKAGLFEKDFSNTSGSGNNHNGGATPLLGKDMDSEAALRAIQKGQSITISPEILEKVYLTPQNQVKGDLRKPFGNPTPLALLGLVMALTLFSCDIVGWKGAGGNGAAATLVTASPRPSSRFDLRTGFFSTIRCWAILSRSLYSVYMATGAFGFAAAAGAWEILFALIFASVDFPLQLPVGDLSHIGRGALEKASVNVKAAEHQV